MIAFVAK